MNKLLDDAKFSDLQTNKNKTSWDCYDIDIANLETDIKQFCLDNAGLAPLFFTLYKALQKPRWVSVDDRFPTEKIDIVLTTQYGNIPSLMIFKHDNWYYWPELILSSSEPSHWIPLPEPPINTEVK